MWDVSLEKDQTIPLGLSCTCSKLQCCDGTCPFGALKVSNSTAGTLCRYFGQKCSSASASWEASLSSGAFPRSTHSSSHALQYITHSVWSTVIHNSACRQFHKREQRNTSLCHWSYLRELWCNPRLQALQVQEERMPLRKPEFCSTEQQLLLRKSTAPQPSEAQLHMHDKYNKL